MLLYEKVVFPDYPKGVGPGVSLHWSANPKTESEREENEENQKKTNDIETKHLRLMYIKSIENLKIYNMFTVFNYISICLTYVSVVLQTTQDMN